MALLTLMALKIALTDLSKRKIRNIDLIIVLTIFLTREKCHLLFLPISILFFGVLFQRIIGSGDSKLLALIAFGKCDLAHFYKSFTLILFLASLISLVYLLKYRTFKTRVPLGPALSVGLLL